MDLDFLNTCKCFEVKPFTQKAVREQIINRGQCDYVKICLKKWNGYDVYVPDYIGCPDIGLPDIFLAKDGKVFCCKGLEVLDVLKKCGLCPDGIYVKSFKLVRGCGYSGYYTRVKYKCTKKSGSVIHYLNEQHGSIISEKEIKLDDPNNKFKKRITSYINGLIYKDYTNQFVCDAEWFELNFTLTNGEKYKITGEGEYPDSYDSLCIYLDRIEKFCRSK